MTDHPLTATMKQKLEKLGNVEPSELQTHTNQPTGRKDKITFDPTLAEFADLLNTNPKTFNEENRGNYKWRRLDMRLNKEAECLFARNGFVVGGCSGATQYSFGSAYDAIYSDDLPVFITADSLLHAWHRTFDELLMVVETTRLMPLLEQVLTSLHQNLVELRKSLTSKNKDGKTDTMLTDACEDMDVYLAVAASLLAGSGQAKTNLGQGNRERAKSWLDVAAAESPSGSVRGDLFGKSREVDASQFKARGHYEKSEELKRYFRAMMWIGRIDLTIGGNGASERELAAATIFAHLARQPKTSDALLELDSTLRAFIGEVDSCTVPQLQSVLDNFCDANGLGKNQLVGGDLMGELMNAVVASGFGVQGVCGDIVNCDGMSSVPEELGVSFTLMGQRFAIDSWVLSNIVFDRVVVGGKKVLHTRPSCVDVLYGCLGNPALAQVVANKVEQKGLPYHSYLIACKQTVDSLPTQIWSQSIYHMWLRCLRKLSDSPVEQQPEFMHTQAWGLKDAETQAASWAQLRHDTILYVKQSYGACCCCEYPAGYVDPRPEFWQAFLDMVNTTESMLFPSEGGLSTARSAVAGLGASLRSVFGQPQERSPFDVMHGTARATLSNWKRSLGTLLEISNKELSGKKMSSHEENFLKTVARCQSGGSGPPTYDGWYPELFYKGLTDAWKMDALVSDVHSNPPGDQDPEGCVVHEATGAPTLMRVAVNGKKGATQYIGPVMTHYEFEKPGLNRVSDSEWQAQISSGDLPPICSWKSAFRVP